MTTNNHLNEFTQIDPEILDELKNTADELLLVNHLDLDNTEYLAKILFCLGKYDESIKQLKRILAMKGKDKKTLASIGINHFKKQNYQKAIEYLNAGLEIEPESECMLTYKMLSYEFLKDKENAVRCGEEILKISPKNASLIKRIIDYHLELKNYDKCMSYITQVEYKDSYKKALVLFGCRRFKECIKESEKAGTAKAYHLAGKAHHELGNISKAARYLYKSYEKDLNTETLFEISQIYFEANDPEKAIYYLRELLLHDEKNAKALSKIAEAYLRSSDWNDAVEYCQKALEITKKLPQTYLTLAQAQFHLNHPNMEEVKHILEEGLRENPESAKLWAKKGELNCTSDSIEFAKSYEKAISIDPMNCEIYVEYIDLLLLRGDVESAKIQYNKLLLVNPLFEKSFKEIEDAWSF